MTNDGKYCDEHHMKLNDLWKKIKGNGRRGLDERVVRLEVLMWIVITLLLGNVGLLSIAMKTIMGLKL